MMNSETDPLLDAPAVGYPLPASFIGAREEKHGRRLPQAIAHRGFKAQHPENTMGAFAGAVKAGAHAIETDIHLSSDGVVVLSHDGNLKRCFGREEKIIDCDWKFLSSLRTLKAPHEAMPRLKDLLEYLAAPERDHLWLLLDIKLDNNARDVMRLIAETILSVAPSNRPWHERILLGFWAANYIPLCHEYLPNFPLVHIGFSTLYARQFLRVPHVSFNMLQKVLVGPFGRSFLKDAKAAGRAIFVWTVNSPDMMRWSIRRQVDGVITDDPQKFLEICDEYDEKTGPEWFSWQTYLDILRIQFMVVLFGAMFRWRYGVPVDRRWTIDAVADKGR